MTLVWSDTQGLFCVQKNIKSEDPVMRVNWQISREERKEMFNIIIYITLGVVFAFCAVMLFCLLPFDKIACRKDRKSKLTDAPAKDDTRAKKTYKK